MTHKETIKRIQELVPDVMKLEFGCRVEEKPAFGSGMRYDTFNGEKVFTIISKYSSKDSWFYLTDIGLGKEKEDKILNWHKILGKPITLAVVLLAILKYEGLPITYLKALQKGVRYHWSDLMFHFRDMNWNLSKDNFNDQSEETKTYIGDLLSNQTTD